jgi:hypothetical protein
METRSRRIPALIMSFIRIYPLEKTIAFAGVAIGNIKPMLAANVTGIARKMGFTCRPFAIPNTTGTNI